MCIGQVYRGGGAKEWLNTGGIAIPIYQNILPSVVKSLRTLLIRHIGQRPVTFIDIKLIILSMITKIFHNSYFPSNSGPKTQPVSIPYTLAEPITYWDRSCSFDFVNK